MRCSILPIIREPADSSAGFSVCAGGNGLLSRTILPLLPSDDHEQEIAEMKNVTVTIKLEMEVPDDWELAKTSDGIDILSMGNGQYLDLTFEPMVTDDIEGTWTNEVDEGFMDTLMDMVVSEDVVYQLTASPAH